MNQGIDYTNFNRNRFADRTADQQHVMAQRNLVQLAELINRLFELRSRLLVVRVDLGYFQDVQHLVTLEMAQRHRQAFLADRRDNPKVFEGLLGYAWGLEHGEHGQGFHYHFLAIYDGAVRYDDIGIGLEIRQYWTEITGEWGYTFVSNFDKNQMAEQGILGIGMIHRCDAELRMNLLERVAAYLTKRSSEFAMTSKLTESGGFRVFSKSRMPKAIDPKKPRRGRPTQR